MGVFGIAKEKIASREKRITKTEHLYKAEDSPLPECLSGQIFEVVGVGSRISFSHDDTSISDVVRTAMQHQLYGCSHCSTFGMEDLSHAT